MNSYCGRKKVNETVIVSDPVIKSDTNCMYICKNVSNFEAKQYTADFMKRLLQCTVYTHSMKTIYLSLSAQVAKETVFT